MREYKFIISTVFWGRQHSDVLIKYTLPAILSFNNIQRLGKNIEYKIFCPREDYEYIRTSPAFKKMGKFCDIERRECSFDVHKHHREMFHEARQKDAILLLLAPDLVYTDGSLLFAFNKIKEGYKSVIFPTAAIRLNQDQVPLDFKNDFYSMGKMFEHFGHAETRQFFTNSEIFSFRPVQKIEKVEGGYKVNSFFYQPVFHDCMNKVFYYSNLEFDVIDRESVYVCKDSRECFYYAFSPLDKSEKGGNRYAEHKIADCAYNMGATPFHKQIYDQGFLLIA